MSKYTFPVVLCGLLAACGDPLAGLDRLRDLDVSANDPSAAAIPSEQELAREGYFGTPAASGRVAVPAKTLIVADPAPKGGLLGLFRRAPVADTQAGVVAAAVAPSESEVLSEDTQTGQDVEVAAVASGTAAPVVGTPTHVGFFGRLMGKRSQSPEAQGAAVGGALAPPVDPQTQLAALSPAPEDTDTSAKPARRGLFARKSNAPVAQAPRTGPDARDVDYGTVLPFGEVARSCVSRGRPLGRKVDRAPANGYTLFDSKPDSAGPRTFYITGFNDGCPRQLTAANVLLGSVSRYEGLYYGPGSEHLPKGETDKAYAKVKRQICGVSRYSPCGAKIGKMERSTFFVTAYSRFGNANSWSELLIHDGEVLASAIKSYK